MILSGVHPNDPKTTLDALSSKDVTPLSATLGT